MAMEKQEAIGNRQSCQPSLYHHALQHHHALQQKGRQQEYCAFYSKVSHGVPWVILPP